MKINLLLSISILAKLILIGPAFAQDGFTADPEVEFTKRVSRSTGSKFQTLFKMDIPETIPPEVRKYFSSGLVTGLMALRFYDPKGTLIPGAGTDDSLPDCDKANVRQDEIVNDSADLDLIDLLFYNYEDKDQMARARNWDRPTAPYLPGDLYNPHSLKDPQQLFARWVNLICLPTRVRRVYNGEGVALLEYREGAKAWTND